MEHDWGTFVQEMGEEGVNQQQPQVGAQALHGVNLQQPQVGAQALHGVNQNLQQPQGINQNLQQPQGGAQALHGFNQNLEQPQGGYQALYGVNQNLQQPQGGAQALHGFNQNLQQPQGGAQALYGGLHLNQLEPQVGGIFLSGLNRQQHNVDVASLTDFENFDNQFELSVRCLCCSETLYNPTYQHLENHALLCPPSLPRDYHYEILNFKCSNTYYVIPTHSDLSIHAIYCKPAIHQ